MSATYNWAYRPGVTNPYGISINPSADDVRPNNACYVALFGNDNTGNGSRQYPYRTFSKSWSAGGNQNVIIGSGVYREDIPQGFSGIGDGDVIFSLVYNLFGNDVNLYNVKVQSQDTITKFVTKDYVNCTFSGVQPLKFISGSARYFGNIFNLQGEGIVFSNSVVSPSHTQGNNTFINTNISITSIGKHGALWSSIYYNCNISLSPGVIIDYSLFYNCKFRFNNSGVYTTINTKTELLTFLFSNDPSNLLAFKNCIVADPIFNNVITGDYTLSINSPAKNLTYLGTYAGAKSIAYGLKIREIESDGDLDFSTAVNVTITNNSLTLTNPLLDGIIETKVIENTLGRQIKSIPIIGLNADRNGQYIDSIADLSSITKNANEVLVIPSSYLVEGGAITYNNFVYTAGQRFTTIMGKPTFTTSTNGVAREIIEAPQRHTIEMKLSNVQPFTTESFNHFEPGITPTTNNSGDNRTGMILRGNGDPNYIRDSALEFPINSKYIKIKFTIRANNLKP